MINARYAVLLIASLAGAATNAFGQSSTDFQNWRLPEQPPYPENNQPTPERIELGRRLFFERQLSGDGKLSCSSCHMAAKAWSDGRVVPIGFGGRPMTRNSQGLVNVGYNTLELMWAGQKKNLEEQVIAAASSHEVMATDTENMGKWLDTPEYKDLFAKAYPNEAIDMRTVAKAIANFERTIVVHDTPFDRWVGGDAGALSSSQLRGLRIFMDERRGNCATCHSAPTFSNNGFFNIGLPSKDIGRFKFNHRPLMMGAFKTPQLRDVEYKAPYMHDGSLGTLEEVVEHYDKGGGHPGIGTVSPDIRPLHLSRQDKRDLVEFLKSLSSPRKTDVAN